MAEGYIYSLPKKGFYVSPILIIKTPLIPAKMILNLLLRKESLLSVISLLIRHQPICFSPATWSKGLKDVLNEHQSELMVNPPVRIVYGIQEAISHHLKRIQKYGC